jgi:hypothetical protein
MPTLWRQRETTSGRALVSFETTSYTRVDHEAQAKEVKIGQREWYCGSAGGET